MNTNSKIESMSLPKVEGWTSNPGYVFDVSPVITISPPPSEISDPFEEYKRATDEKINSLEKIISEERKTREHAEEELIRVLKEQEKVKKVKTFTSFKSIKNCSSFPDPEPIKVGKFMKPTLSSVLEFCKTLHTPEQWLEIKVSVMEAEVRNYLLPEAFKRKGMEWTKLNNEEQERFVNDSIEPLQGRLYQQRDGHCYHHGDLVEEYISRIPVYSYYNTARKILQKYGY